MDVNTVDLNDLLPAAGAVEVMFTKNDTPHPIAAILKKKRIDIHNQGLDVAQITHCKSV